MAVFGAIEAGGTKFVCALGSGPDDLRSRSEFPTTSPEETIGRAVAFFSQWTGNEPLTAIGVASFGPIDVHAGSPSYGHITSTPKSGWQNTDLVGPLRQAFGLPVGFDTDVNGAGLAEHLWGAARGLDSFIYITVGTGIGGGGMVEGQLMHGMLHPEMGHMRIPHDRQADPYAGACPFHGDCLEGLASGPAIESRWGGKGQSLAAGHQAWELEAQYLAFCVANLVCTLSPQRIILGGGVMHQPGLLPLVRGKAVQLLNGYIRVPELLHSIDDYVVAPSLGDNAGVLGGIALAMRAAQATSR